MLDVELNGTLEAVQSIQRDSVRNTLLQKTALCRRKPLQEELELIRYRGLSEAAVCY